MFCSIGARSGINHGGTLLPSIASCALTPTNNLSISCSVLSTRSANDRMSCCRDATFGTAGSSVVVGLAIDTNRLKGGILIFAEAGGKN
jgi:hypothetical protein